MNKLYKKFEGFTIKLQDLSLFFFRLILAYGFFQPAKMKISDFNAIAGWFDSLNYPLPTFSAYLAGITETLGVILLFLGFGTRIISIPLIFVMLVAIFTVHFENGFAAGDNGFEIPLYYLLMLFGLLTFGSGKISIDYVLKERKRKL